MTNSELKFLRSLQQKKYRQENQYFLVEGTKSVLEASTSALTVKQIYATEKWIREQEPKIAGVEQITKTQCEQVSSFSTSPEVFALIEIPDDEVFEKEKNNKILLLDAVRDPGNLGTIMRTADWFGIKSLICSKDSVDVFNPKTLQASMGSFTRVSVFYLDLEQFIVDHEDYYTFYGAFMDGNSIAQINFPRCSAVVLGNESQGISRSVRDKISHRISIKRGVDGAMLPESLNIAVSAAICCYQMLQ